MQAKTDELPDNSHGDATALLVIDVQRGLFTKSTPIYQGERLLANITLLVERAHQVNTPVFYIQHGNDSFLVEGTDDWQLHPVLQPRDEDRIVHKRHGSAFEDTPLEAELLQRNVGRLVITGLVTHGCVRATCQDALRRGYQVMLVEDGHSSYSKDAAKKIVEWNKNLEAAGAKLIPAGGVSFYADN